MTVLSSLLHDVLFWSSLSCVHFMTCTRYTGCRLCSLCGAMLWATVHSGQGTAGRCCCSSGRRWCHRCQRGSHPAPAEEEQHASPHCSLMGPGELRTHVWIQAAACITQDSSLSSGCAIDMVSYQGIHLGTFCGYQARNRTLGLMQMLW